MFIFRLFSFTVFILLFLASIFLESFIGSNLIGFIIFSVLCIFLSYFAIFEFCHMISRENRNDYFMITPAVGTIMVILFLLKNDYNAAYMVMAFFSVFSWIYMLFAAQNKDSLIKILNSLAAIFCIVVPLSFLILLYNEDKYLLLYLILVTKTGDTAAYITGTLTHTIFKNNHKIVPSISPKKSWEGTIGGLVFSVIVSIFLWKLMLTENYMEVSTVMLAAAGVILFAGGFAGDLAESALKRICGVKDSGRIVPGMGGTLDVVDSLILNAPAFYLCIFIFKSIKF